MGAECNGLLGMNEKSVGLRLEIYERRGRCQKTARAGRTNCHRFHSILDSTVQTV